MNRKQQSVVLAGLLALALAGCGSTRGSSDQMGGGATASGSGSSGAGSSTQAGATAATGGADTTGSMATQAPGAAGQAAMPAGAPNAMVMLIEVMPRPSAAGAGSAAVGGSGTAGTTGSSSMGDEKMYRITLRMDDGTTRVVTQDKPPTFRNGDRVNMMDGMITK